MAPWAPGPRERVPQLGEHVVEAEDPTAEAAESDQIHGPPDQLAQELLCLGGAGLAPGRHEVEIGLPVGQRGRPVEDFQRREQLDGVPVHGGTDEDVGARRPDEFGRVHVERRVGIGPGRHAEGAEHLLRESVDGGDRGGVELGDGPLQSLELSGGPPEVQVGEELVVGRGGLVGREMVRATRPADP